MEYLFLWQIEHSYAGRTYSKNYLTKEVVPINDYEDIELD